MALLLALLIQPTDASWCSRLFDNFIERIAVPDPNTYEEYWTGDLLAVYVRYGQKGYANNLTPDEAIWMNIAGCELRWRLGPVMRQFELPDDIPKIEDALEIWSQYEGHAPEAKGRR